MYFAAARVVSYYSVSIVAHSMALNVTVQSYDGRLNYGHIACRRAIPDLTDLGDSLHAEREALLARAQAHVDAQQATAATQPDGKKMDLMTPAAVADAVKTNQRGTRQSLREIARYASQRGDRAQTQTRAHRCEACCRETHANQATGDGVTRNVAANRADPMSASPLEASGL